MTRLASILFLAFSMGGCSVLMSGKDVGEHLELMRQRNPMGCAYISGSGTPPASRIDGAGVFAWGQNMTPEQFKECVDTMSTLVK